VSGAWLILLGAVSGAGAGLLAGLIGIGGGIVVVPVVYYGLIEVGTSADQAAHVAVRHVAGGDPARRARFLAGALARG
jgi:uncharacterized membrane protein YfcA